MPERMPPDAIEVKIQRVKLVTISHVTKNLDEIQKNFCNFVAIEES